MELGDLATVSLSVPICGLPMDCLSPILGMESVSFPQWYRVPVRMGCFPGRTFLVGASVMGKAAMMATYEPYSSGVIITTR